MNGSSRKIRTSVLIVGGGPVGLTLAMDLAWRDIDVIVAEKRPADAPSSAKCGQISARSMEVFRRLGLAGKLREVGLPADYPNDIVSAVDAKIDIDIRHTDSLWIQEPLEQKPIFYGINICDVETISDQGAGG